MEKLANQIGYLVLNEDGAVIESGGDLENDEESANIIMGLINITDSVDDSFMPRSSCERITLSYENHSYNICKSNKRIYIAKLKVGGSSAALNVSNTLYADMESSSSGANNNSNIIV